MANKKYLQALMVAYNDTSGLKGVGPPAGVPASPGLVYLDVVSGIRYLSRNALNFNLDTMITTPIQMVADKITLLMWHNDPAPAVMRPFLCTSNYSQRVIRTVTAGFIDSTGPISSLKINGVTTPDNSTDIALSTWTSLEFTYNSPFMPIDNIGRRPTLQGFSGRLASVVFSLGGSAIGSYAIDDNNGSVIADGSGNGYNATLDIGSGSWQLDWVPL